MTFISYAQNFEDVMLCRALKNIENGFYIDIGAAWPDEHSVTKAFYERGWHGVNVEPNPTFNKLLIEQRPKDIILAFAVGSQEGILKMNFFRNTGLSTLDDEIANKHQIDGREIERLDVEVVTLSKIWRDYVSKDQPVHFLKVDVEGYESEAIKGNDWSTYRPWVVVVEATLPLSQEESHEEWESLLLDADYLFAYADGLNRFYVAKEHQNLLSAFKYPPNVFDDFKLAKHEQAENLNHVLTVKVKDAEAKAEQVVSNLIDIYASTSWRITAPLRWIGQQIIFFKQHGLKKRVRALFRKILQHFIFFINNKPRLKRRVSSTARRLGLEKILRPIYMSSTYGLSLQNVQKESNHLTPSSKYIYQQLKLAIKNKKRQN